MDERANLIGKDVGQLTIFHVLPDPPEFACGCWDGDEITAEDAGE